MWLYGRLAGGLPDASERPDAHITTTTAPPATTTTAPPATTTTTPPAPDPTTTTTSTTTTTTTTVPPTPGDGDGGPVVWPEPEDPGDSPDPVDVIGGDDPDPQRWWPGRTRNDCHFGGWVSNFPPGLFKNRGDCQSYFASVARNKPNGPLAHLYPPPPTDWHPGDR